jgi:L-asparaginase II
MQPVALVTVSRSGLVESTHYGDIVAANCEGRVLAFAGNVERLAYMRSSSKPLQALLVLQTGAADSFGFSEKEVAICCASHSGSAEHVETVLGILDKLGLSEADLECGTHMPGDTEERQRITAEGVQPSPAHNNCSGKHCGMLASARAMDVATAGYSKIEHPVQQKTLANMAAMCEIAAGDIRLGTDGCGVPTFGMPLRNMAIGYARLTSPENGLCPASAESLRIADAMAAAPVMISGAGSFNTTLLEVGGKEITCKGGAEGLFMVGVRGGDMGMAVKVSDAGGRAQAPAVLAALAQLEILSEEQREKMAAFARPEVRNCHDDLVGEIRAVLELEFNE